MSSRTAPRFQRVVVKVGASVLTDAGGRLESAVVSRLAEQLAGAVSERRQVVLVSSGAIACGMAQLGLSRRPKGLAQLQACAAIGQGQLMHRYHDAFARHRVTVAQVLLTAADLVDRTRCRNARNTFATLLRRGVVPIVNENDTVAVDEITFGDNDRLAALVASLIGADLLVILSDVDGLLRDGKVIRRLKDVTRAHHRLIARSSRQTTTGGMASKLAAGRLCRHAGIPMVIANGGTPGILTRILSGKPVGTLIAPPATRLASPTWWRAFSTLLARER